VPPFAASHWNVFRRKPLAYLSALGSSWSIYLKYRLGAGAAAEITAQSFVKEFLQAGFIAAESLQSGRIRHLHSHFCHTSATVTMLASRMCRLPFSFTAHAKDIYRRDMNPGDLLTVKMRRAKFAVTCTRANEEHLNRLRPPTTPLHTIYHGLDLSFFNPEVNGTNAVNGAHGASGASMASMRNGAGGAEVGTSEQRSGPVAGARQAPGAESARPPLILSVGRLVEKKGFTYLVEACSRLREKGYRFECRIIGAGGGKGDRYAETVRSLIEQLQLDETVTLHPAVTQEELLDIYREAVAFALPCQVVDDGDRDGIPNVLVEAMAMELPVVSTAISGIPELIEDRVDGLLAPPKDPAALAEALEELLNDPALRRQLGRAARVKVCRHFDSGRNIEALKRLFDAP
jgi:glycosyltransferase involved in cell wall biosynthesis